MTEKIHYLRLFAPNKDHRAWLWSCVCGAADARGEGPTEEACEYSYDRHVKKEALRKRRGLS